MIQGVSKVVVPVADQERAKQFWTQQMGFTVGVDEPYGDQGRWIEVLPPDKGVILVLSRRDPDQVRPEVPEMLPDRADQDALWLVVAVRGRRGHPLRP